MTLFVIKGVTEMSLAQAGVVTIALKMARKTAAKENKTKKIQQPFFGLYFFFFFGLEEYCSDYHNEGPSLQSPSLPRMLCVLTMIEGLVYCEVLMTNMNFTSQQPETDKSQMGIYVSLLWPKLQKSLAAP